MPGRGKGVRTQVTKLTITIRLGNKMQKIQKLQRRRHAIKTAGQLYNLYPDEQFNSRFWRVKHAEVGGPSLTKIQELFGSWNQFLDACGIAVYQCTPWEFSDKEVIRHLRRYRKRHGAATMTDCRSRTNRGKLPSASLLQSRPKLKRKLFKQGLLVRATRAPQLASRKTRSIQPKRPRRMIVRL